MEYKVVGNIVTKIEQIVTPSQTAIVETYHDTLLHTELTYVASKVTARVYDYLGELQTAYNQPVTFEYEGTTYGTGCVAGVATMDFVATVKGDHIVRTLQANMRNGEVTIIV